MIGNALEAGWEKIRSKYEYLSRENYFRIMVLAMGVKVGSENSYPDKFSRVEIKFKAGPWSPIPVLTLINPDSDFEIIRNRDDNFLFYQKGFVCRLTEMEVTTYDLRKEEPFYFFVREVNGDLVLKLNPQQLCSFYKNNSGDTPCQFCFRNDGVVRYRNIDADDLIGRLRKDKSGLLKKIDEVSLITGTYRGKEECLFQITEMVREVKKIVPRGCWMVAGSHEFKKIDDMKRLKKAGVTNLAYPVESLDNEVRRRMMKNGKGSLEIEEVLDIVRAGVKIFGEDKVICRLLAGVGDRLDNNFIKKVEIITKMGEKGGPLWNINVYMPFTHSLWNEGRRDSDIISYLFEYHNIINQLVDKKRLYRFKISV